MLKPQSRYEGNPEKFWAYYEEQELRQTLEQAQFQVMDMTVIGKQFDYQTHPALRAFCQKK